jgi:hypothetical protein
VGENEPPELEAPLSDDEKRLVAALEKDLRPSLRDRGEVLTRLQRLVNLATTLKGAQGGAGSTAPSQIESDDILRAVVVFTHAYLEDFLRTLARSFLPLADKDILNEVPLAGMKERTKFQLGDLAQHGDKSVDNVIQESVDQYLERSTFNGTDDIALLLKSLKFDVSRHNEHFPALNAMIRRRHIIVHRADRAGAGDDSYVVQPIDAELVMNWVLKTNEFMNSVLRDVTVIFHWRRYREMYGEIDVQHSNE